MVAGDFVNQEAGMATEAERIREEFGNGDAQRDRGLFSPETVERFDDIVYGTEHPLQVLDVYRPKNRAEEKLPVIVSIHGGAWVYGTKETYQYYCMSLAERGFAVINFSYRLAPENKFPAALEDVTVVFRWMLEHQETYGFDCEKVFGVGDSAGAHLLSLFIAMGINERYAQQFSFRAPEKFRFRAVALNCGVYELEKNATDELTMLLLKEVLPKGGTEEEMNWINPLPFLTKDFPPSFVMTCNEDFLKEQAPLMVARLESLKVPVQYHCYGTDAVRLYHVFHCNVKLKEATQCNDDECDFFRNYMEEIQ